jgi:hypothetical protein
MPVLSALFALFHLTFTKSLSGIIADEEAEVQKYSMICSKS